MNTAHDEIIDEHDGRPELIKQRARSLFWYRFTIAILVLYMLITASISAFNAVLGLQTREALLGCVTPDHPCYEEGQKRTGEVVQQLIDANALDEVTTRRIVLAATTCAERVENDTFKKIEECVNKQIEEEGKG